ncbi:GIY-YIG nuclease family protein [Luteibacter sp. 329MFSha]|uniref:GIY-YIG nuclease family protein n=1 Tax=Luteibacter sp. 329MFSha TaxID=1798239 RepID=UPI0008D3BF26|nr:GIY-YIG nuclease family protein [Luteibacter sp. 329MFSha]SEV92608.1 GIY-YIG catalytic domain-containing protein [Luteibacter sp. 329MFSha]
MITINALLEINGIDLKTTRLVRHQDKRGTLGRTPHSLWLSDDGSFDRYQAIQGTERFSVGGSIVSFVVTPIGETIFVGVYTVDAIGVTADDTVDPLLGHDVTGLHSYTLSPHPALAEYRGRIVIEWGPGARAWVQRGGMTKPVIEIRRAHTDPPYPGHDGFMHTIRDLGHVPQTWRTVLTAAKGVYLLVSLKTGKQYVGSATGEDGFWGRWATYAANGHGGNIGLKLASEDDYAVTILEVASSKASVADILASEAKWKAKLLTKLHGTNRN